MAVQSDTLFRGLVEVRQDQFYVTLNGQLADAWNDGLLEERNANGETKKVRVKKDGTSSEAAWLFGSDSDHHAAAGALLLTEAGLLAFPIRSAKGSFAWITSPLILNRYRRALRADYQPITDRPGDEEAIFTKGGVLETCAAAIFARVSGDMLAGGKSRKAMETILSIESRPKFKV